MDSLFTDTLFFLIALTILIGVHEFGHFWVARRLGVTVLRFSIGFGRALWRRVSPKDGTEYTLCILPLGGYVKMLDEREEPVAEADRPWAFNNQSLWKRSAIVAAGPLTNLLFAVFAYWLVLISGDTGLRPLIGGVAPASLAERAGFQPGDELLAMDDRLTPTWEIALLALMAQHLDGQDVAVHVRDAQGRQQIRRLEGNALAHLADTPDLLQEIGLDPKRPLVPARVGQLVSGGPAAQAGVRVGDLLLSADGQAITDWSSWVDYVRARPGQSIHLRVQRQNHLLTIELVPRAVQNGEQTIGQIGAYVQVPAGLDRYQITVRLGPLDALDSAVRTTVIMSTMTLQVLKRMLMGQASLDNLSGPISIAESAGKSASYGLVHFLKFLAIVSISLGILNLMPVPILDGGHLLFFLIEGVKGSPLPESLQAWGQRVGAAVLLALMVLAFYMDLGRLLG